MALDNFAAELLSHLPRIGAPRQSLAMLGRQHLTVTRNGLGSNPPWPVSRRNWSN